MRCSTQVGFLRKGTEIAESFDAEEMQRNFLRVRATKCTALADLAEAQLAGL